jgi:hypothetical protein
MVTPARSAVGSKSAVAAAKKDLDRIRPYDGEGLLLIWGFLEQGLGSGFS